MGIQVQLEQAIAPDDLQAMDLSGRRPGRSQQGPQTQQ
jgi:hypothetical protein